MNKLLCFLSITLLAPALAKPLCAQGAAPAPLPQSAHLALNFDILSDTGGVNVNPYLKNLVPTITKQWTGVVAANHPPLRTQEALLTLTIASDGHVLAMRLEDPQDTLLDNAAWNAMKEAACLPPPAGMRNPDLKLRVHFKVD